MKTNNIIEEKEIDADESQRKNDFLSANPGKSSADFDWAKNIWENYATELEVKTNARLNCGFTPLSKAKLLQVHTYLLKLIAQINEEIGKRP
jgi:hypothetical protein